MRSIARCVALAAVLAGVTSCLPPRALNPFYTQADLVMDHRLIGTFNEEGDSLEPIRIRAPETEGGPYLLVDPDPDSTSLPLAGRLFRLGGFFWLDISASHQPWRADDWFFAPLHWVCRVDFPDDDLELGCLEEEWLRDRIEAGSAEAMAILVDDEIILTGTTEELQAFLLRHADDPDAFPAGRLQRVGRATEPQR